MLRASEREWGRKHGLRKTKLSFFCRGKIRNVYESSDGRLFYIDDCHWNGVSRKACVDFDEEV